MIALRLLVFLLMGISVGCGVESSPKNRQNMSTPLQTVLTATDLDDLLAAIQQLQPNDLDPSVIGATIQGWEDEQAVANFLFYPFLIPAELRLPAIRRALEETEQPYYTLAIVVGLQWFEPGQLPPEETREIRDRLFDLIRSDSSIIAVRASTSLSNFVDESDAERMCGLLDHPDDTVRHNVLAWLLRNVGGGNADNVADLIGRSQLSSNLREEALQKAEQHAKITSEGGFSTIDVPLFGYIPNLTEFTPDQGGAQ
jgi:hypothetical protein